MLKHEQGTAGEHPYLKVCNDKEQKTKFNFHLYFWLMFFKKPYEEHYKKLKDYKEF